jgi:hypothetical protein
VNDPIHQIQERSLSKVTVFIRIRAWSRFATRALLEGTLPPADVLFFAVRNEISTAVSDWVAINFSLMELFVLSPSPA